MTLVHARALLGIEKISLSSLDLKVSYKLFKPTGEQINRVSIIYPIVVINSVCCRRNLTPVSSVCEAAPLSLFCAGHGLNELPEMHCEFPFNLIGKLTMDFEQANHGTLWNPVGIGQGVKRCFAYRLHQAPVVQKADNAIHWINLYPMENDIGFPNAYPLDSTIQHLKNQCQKFSSVCGIGCW